MNISKFISPNTDKAVSPLEKRVEAFFSKFGSKISQDEIAVCIPSVHLREKNHIDALSGFKHVFIFVMPDEYELYSAKFPWATCVKRVSTTLCECRNEIIEYMLKTTYTYFMLSDDDVFWRKYYYPADMDVPKTGNANDPTEVCSIITKNIGLMDKLGADVLYFDRGGFTTSKLNQRLSLKFGSPTFCSFVFRTKIFENPMLRYTEDITVPEDDAMNELLQYLNYKYIKAIDILVGNLDGAEECENEETNSVINYVSHNELWNRVKKFRAEKKQIGLLQALRNYGYPDLK